MAYKRKVLSIDGGGIRGIIPAMLLAEIERQTGKRIADLFDLVAGTSTGGIIALGLTKPHPQDPSLPHFTAADLVDFYKNYGKEIFYEPLHERLTLFLDDLLKPKYHEGGRDRVLTELLGNIPLSSTIREVLLTSYDIDNRFPVFFTSDPRKEEIPDRGYRKVCNGFTMKQSAMATSAAPTYFRPYQIPTDDPTRNGAYVLVDGGVFANNPTALAIIEIIGTYRIDMQSKGLPNQNLPVDEVLVLSLGTGSLTRAYSYKQARNWGILKWIKPLINITLDGTSEVVAVQLNHLLAPHQLHRFQGFLDPGRGNDEIDKISDKNIADLESLARSIIKERKHDIEKLCETLLEPNVG
ncbi:MAG: patatin-like phospholipase family protein [Elainellaceae cyanobacterium]